MRKLLVASVAMVLSCALQAEGLQSVDHKKFRSEKSYQELPDGVNLSYFEAGNPKGKPLIFIHGYTDSSRTWTSLFPFLDMSYRYIFVDLRGHGDSSAPECCYALPDMAYDIKLLMDKLQIGKASIIGHSLGSIVTQTIAEKWPERVDKVVLVGSGVSTLKLAPEVSHEIFVENQLQEPIDPNSKFMNWWMGNFGQESAELVEYSKQDAASIPLYVWRGVLDTLSTEDFGRRLSALKAPVLIMNGDHDSFWDKESQAKLKASLPGAKIITYQTGHNLHWEAPKNTAKDILNFVGS